MNIPSQACRENTLLDSRDFYKPIVTCVTVLRDSFEADLRFSRTDLAYDEWVVPKFGTADGERVVPKFGTKYGDCERVVPTFGTVCRPFEMELATVPGAEWNGEYEADFRRLLPKLARECAAPPPDTADGEEDGVSGLIAF